MLLKLRMIHRAALQDLFLGPILPQDRSRSSLQGYNLGQSKLFHIPKSLTVRIYGPLEAKWNLIRETAMKFFRL